MVNEKTNFYQKNFGEKMSRFQEVVESMYGIARFGAFTGTLLFATFYFLSFVKESNLVSSVYTYLILLTAYEIFKFIKRSINLYCENSEGDDQCKKEISARKKSIGARLGEIYTGKGLNKFILIVWGFLIVVQQGSYGYREYHGIGETFIPEDFAIAAVLVFVICGIGLMSNAIFMVKHPGFKKFLEEVALVALHGKHADGNSVEQLIEKVMWEKRKEWIPLDEEKCGQCVKDLSSELMFRFPEFRERENDINKLILEILDHLTYDEQAKVLFKTLLKKLSF